MTNSAFIPYRNDRIELDLREEMKRLLYGAEDEIAKGKIGLLRRMRRDDNGELVRCSCRDKVTDEPDRDHYCRYCSGHGYFWDEYKMVYYRNDDAFMKSEGKVKDFEGVFFYIEWFADIDPTDVLVEIKLDKDGYPVQPLQRLKVYDILSSDAFCADYGRTEFWQIRAKDRREWSVYYGVKNRQHN